MAGALGLTTDAELVDDVVMTLSTPLREIWTQELASAQARGLEGALKLAVPEGGHGQRFRVGLATALTDLSRSSAWIPGAGESPLRVAVTGLPVLHRGLSRSVRTNQVSSLVFALGVVLILMTLLFRSPLSGLVALFPTAITLLVIERGTERWSLADEISIQKLNSRTSSGLLRQVR